MRGRPRAAARRRSAPAQLRWRRASLRGAGQLRDFVGRAQRKMHRVAAWWDTRDVDGNAGNVRTGRVLKPCNARGRVADSTAPLPGPQKSIDRGARAAAPNCGRSAEGQPKPAVPPDRRQHAGKDPASRRRTRAEQRSDGRSGAARCSTRMRPRAVPRAGQHSVPSWSRCAGPLNWFATNPRAPRAIQRSAPARSALTSFLRVVPVA